MESECFCCRSHSVGAIEGRKVCVNCIVAYSRPASCSPQAGECARCSPPKKQAEEAGCWQCSCGADASRTECQLCHASAPNAGKAAKSHDNLYTWRCQLCGFEDNCTAYCMNCPSEAPAGFVLPTGVSEVYIPSLPSHDPNPRLSGAALPQIPFVPPKFSVPPVQPNIPVFAPPSRQLVNPFPFNPAQPPQSSSDSPKVLFNHRVVLSDGADSPAKQAAQPVWVCTKCSERNGSESGKCKKCGKEMLQKVSVAAPIAVQLFPSAQCSDCGNPVASDESKCANCLASPRQQPKLGWKGKIKAALKKLF